jgi:cellulose synthase/poly-beta-1,6-N-acetylglucosamine synthase-like glycosyltransferase
VVLDGASTDGTVEEAKRWADSGVRPPVTLLVSSHRQGKASDLGAFHKSLLSTGRNKELVVVCDADVAILPGSLKALLEPLVNDPDLGVAWGVDLPDNCSWGRWASSFQMVAFAALVRANGSATPIAYGRFFAYRVERLANFAWQEAKGADDAQLSEFVKSQRIPFQTVPTATVEATPAGNYRDFYLQTYRWFAAQAQFSSSPEVVNRGPGPIISRKFRSSVRRWAVFGRIAIKHPMWAISYIAARAVAWGYHQFRPAIFDDQWRPSGSTKGAPS